MTASLGDCLRRTARLRSHELRRGSLRRILDCSQSKQSGSIGWLAEPKRLGAKAGGARRDRTDDLMLAKHALSQLSYGPLTGKTNAMR